MVQRQEHLLMGGLVQPSDDVIQMVSTICYICSLQYMSTICYISAPAVCYNTIYVQQYVQQYLCYNRMIQMVWTISYISSLAVCYNTICYNMLQYIKHCANNMLHLCLKQGVQYNICTTIHICDGENNMLHLLRRWTKISISHHFSSLFNAHSK